MTLRFETDDSGSPLRACCKTLQQRVMRHHRPARFAGVVQIVITDHPSASFFCTLRNTAECHIGWSAAPEATIEITAAQLIRLVSDPTIACRCDEYPGLLGQVRGDSDLAGVLAQAIKGEYSPGARRLRVIQQDIARQGPYERGVRRVAAATAAQLLAFLERGSPVVLTDMLSAGGWRWSADRIRREMGQLPLQRLGAVVLGATNDCDTVGALINRARDPDLPGSYSGGCALPEAMRPSFELPLLDAQCFTHPQLWAGRKTERPCTDLHRDFLHGFIGQVFGSKRFLLYAPDQERALYPGPCYNTYQPANVEPLHPDLERYPLFKHAQAIELTLGPAELLVLPAGWFHAVYGTEPVMSIGRFMREPSWERLRQGAPTFLA